MLNAKKSENLKTKQNISSHLIKNTFVNFCKFSYLMQNTTNVLNITTFIMQKNYRFLEA